MLPANKSVLLYFNNFFLSFFKYQLAEQNNVFETHKRNLTEMVKELINELAEEKKKIAGVQIELDRMRKLTTTV